MRGFAVAVGALTTRVAETKLERTSPATRR